MKITLLAFLFLLSNFKCFSQKVERDFFDNLLYESADGTYQSKLETDIFNGLLFTDNRGNQLKFENDYLTLEYANLLTQEDTKLNFFTDLSHRYQFENGYEADYSVDIFNKIIIEKNKIRRDETGLDIFGNSPLGQNNGLEIEIKRGIDGRLEYGSRSALTKYSHSWDHPSASRRTTAYKRSNGGTSSGYGFNKIH